MVFVKNNNIRDRFTYRGNHGAGIGNVMRRGRRMVRKRNGFWSDMLNKGKDFLIDKGMDLYNNNKETIHKAIKDKAGDIVKGIVDKAAEIAPDPIAKKIIKNSDLINSVSKKYIDEMVGSASKKADSGLNGLSNMAKNMKIDPYNGIDYQQPRRQVETYQEPQQYKDSTYGSGVKKRNYKKKGSGLSIL